jgi:hypothetical protein
MSEHPFFENLDTSFVNLDSLVRYLRRRKFVGTIRVEFTGYKGEVVFNADGKLRVHEFDRVAGETVHGEKAFNNIIVRAKDAGGIINVIQTLSEAPPDIKPEVETAMVVASNGIPINGNGKTNGNGMPAKNGNVDTKTDHESAASPLLRHLNFPYKLANDVEDRARESRNPITDFDRMVELTGELLNTIDGALEHAGLDFSAAFERACGDVSDEYPFLDPPKRTFKYSCGKVYIKNGADLDLLPNALGEALARIFDRLSSAPKLGKVYRFTVQKVRLLVHSRREQFDRVLLTAQIERAIGS